MSDWSHIELSSGIVAASSIESSDGVRRLQSEIGKLRFFVDAIDAAGGRMNFHVRPDYETAIRLGEESRNALEIDHPVHDNVAGSY